MVFGPPGLRSLFFKQTQADGRLSSNLWEEYEVAEQRDDRRSGNMWMWCGGSMHPKKVYNMEPENHHFEKENHRGCRLSWADKMCFNTSFLSEFFPCHIPLYCSFHVLSTKKTEVTTCKIKRVRNQHISNRWGRFFLQRIFFPKPMQIFGAASSIRFFLVGRFFFSGWLTWGLLQERILFMQPGLGKFSPAVMSLTYG